MNSGEIESSSEGVGDLIFLLLTKFLIRSAIYHGRTNIVGGQPQHTSSRSHCSPQSQKSLLTLPNPNFLLVPSIVGETVLLAPTFLMASLHILSFPPVKHVP